MRTILCAVVALSLAACNTTPTPEKACSRVSNLPAGKGKSHGFDYETCMHHLTKMQQQNPSGYKAFAQCLMNAPTLAEAEDTCVPPRN